MHRTGDGKVFTEGVLLVLGKLGNMIQRVWEGHSKKWLP